MSKVFVAVGAFVVFGTGAAGLWHFYPELFKSIEQELSASTPIYQWRD